MATRTSKTYSQVVVDLTTLDDAALIEDIKKQEATKTDANLRQAYAVRILVDERGWKASDVANSTGLTASTIGRYLSRGRLVHVLPIEAHRLAWSQIATRGVSDEVLEQWTAALTATSQDDRAARLTELSTRRVVADRLGEVGTPENIDALAESIIAARSFTPAAVAAAVPGQALAAGIELPKAKREPQVNEKAPTFQNASRAADAFRVALAAAIADRIQGTETGKPVTITADEAKHLREIHAHVATLMDGLKQFEDVARLADVVANTSTITVSA